MDREQMFEEESLLLSILIGEHEARWWKRHMFKVTDESSVVNYFTPNEMIHFWCSFERFSQTVEMVHHRFVARSRNETPILRITFEKDTQHRWTPCSVLIETHLLCSFEARREESIPMYQAQSQNTRWCCTSASIFDRQASRSTIRGWFDWLDLGDLNHRTLERFSWWQMHATNKSWHRRAFSPWNRHNHSHHTDMSLHRSDSM